MFEYSHKSFVHFGYNEKDFTLRSQPEDIFYLNYKPCDQTPKSFTEELVRAAQLVETASPKEKWVCFSGGMDSEVTLRAFQMADIPINAAILRFNDGANDHDIEYALSYCKKNSVAYEVFEINLLEFFEKNLKNYEFVQCSSPQFYPIMWLIENIIELGGLPIVGNGDSCLKRIECTNNFVFIECEKYFSYYHFLLQKGFEGIPAFLQYTPELFYSFLTSPKVLEYINGRAKDEKLISISKWKHSVYNSFFPIEDREVFNGFEKINHIDKRYRDKLEKKFPGSNGEYRVPYHELVTHLRGRP